MLKTETDWHQQGGKRIFDHASSKVNTFFQPNHQQQFTMMGLSPVNNQIDYAKELEVIREFLSSVSIASTFSSDANLIAYDSESSELAFLNNNPPKIKKYLTMLHEVARLKRTLVTIDLDDLLQYDVYSDDSTIEPKNKHESSSFISLYYHIVENTYRYVQLFSKVVDELMPETTGVNLEEMEPVSVMITHRIARLRDDKKMTKEEILATMPPTLLRRYTLTFNPPSKSTFSINLTKPMSVRQVHSEHVGKLVTIRAIVTRVSEVKPLLIVATYTCDMCGSEVYQEVTASAFMPVIECPSESCKKNNVKGQLTLQTRGSRFQKYQEGRVQELTDQVPMGHIPRSMAVQFYGDLTRQVGPGDQVILTGIFMPRPYSGFKAIKAGLLTDTYLLAQNVQHIKATGLLKSPSDTFAQVMEGLVQNRLGSTYSRLANSIAPEIFGHEDVKKAILLLMVGGVDKHLTDGMHIRGAINVCLMGDPGVAKSQLLKWVAKAAPRAVYTTGKGSSGVGLTAAVTKDAVTGELVLEGGALVLADQGICCIDEFDKMDDSDRTSIHEVMEQQTISIAKAGITTTLNARTSILAAANPLYGRYNPRKSPKENINLPPALLSRFDLLFLILDTPNDERDAMLAEHVCFVHRTGSAPVTITDNEQEQTLPSDVFRVYLAEASKREPVVPDTLVDHLVHTYTRMRASDETSQDGSYTTARTLLGILRLSQALAKIQGRDELDRECVDEALRLMQVSRASITDAMRYGRGGKHSQHVSVRQSDRAPITRLHSLIKSLFLGQNIHGSSSEDSSLLQRQLPIPFIRTQAHAAGFSDEQLEQCLLEYDAADVWTISEDGTALKMLVIPTAGMGSVLQNTTSY